jgi:hypothetical protein
VICKNPFPREGFMKFKLPWLTIAAAGVFAAAAIPAAAQETKPRAAIGIG